MGQLNFHANFYGVFNLNVGVSHQSIFFSPMILEDNISFINLNFLVNKNATGGTHSIYIGLYSLSQSSLSLANSISGTLSVTAANYFPLTATSSSQNITPGNWWWGYLLSTNSVSNHFIFGANVINPANAFPGNFIGGLMTVTSSQLPSNIATSDLDITGLTEMVVPLFILTA